MMTRAGRLRTTTSHGSPTASAHLTRPISNPSAVPATMAREKLSTTRTRVAPSATNNVPDWASVKMDVKTAPGLGNSCGPAREEPMLQMPKNSARERSRSMRPSGSGNRRVERVAVKVGGGSDERAAADAGEHVVEGACVGGLVGDRPARNAIPIAVAVDFQGRRVAGADQPGNPLPFGIRTGKNLLGLAPSRHKPRQGLGVRGRPAGIEHIANQGRPALHAKRR